MEPQKKNDGFWKGFAIVLLLVLLALTGFTFLRDQGGRPVFYESSKSGSQLANLSPALNAPNGNIYWVADLADKSLPFVVNVRTVIANPHEGLDMGGGNGGQGNGQMPDLQQMLPEPFRHQFNWQFQQPEGQDNGNGNGQGRDNGEAAPLEDQAGGEGSGFIVREDGYIVTNSHVVEGAKSYKVRTEDGKEYDAKLIGKDNFKDIAVLKIDANNLPTATLGDSEAVRIGEPVVAIGSPIGFEATVTAGIVSTNKRKMEEVSGQPDDVRRPKSYLQTDAAINRGNSGGPLINAKGEVIGVNQAIARWDRDYTDAFGQWIPIEGIGFAIPINDVKASIQEIVEHGKVVYPGISAQIASVTDYLARNPELKLDVQKGVYVVAVTKGGPADRAGIEAGDVIESINKIAVDSGQSLIEQIQSYHVGDRVTLRVARQGGKKLEDITVVLGELDTSEVAVGQ